MPSWSISLMLCSTTFPLVMLPVSKLKLTVGSTDIPVQVRVGKSVYPLPKFVIVTLSTASPLNTTVPSALPEMSTVTSEAAGSTVPPSTMTIPGLLVLFLSEEGPLKLSKFVWV